MVGRSAGEALAVAASPAQALGAGRRTSLLPSPAIALIAHHHLHLQGMAEAVTALLTEKGVPAERILTNF